MLNATKSLRLFEAIQTGQKSSIEFLLNIENIDINITHTSNGSTPLHAACTVGDTETVVALLRRGADVHASNGVVQPLHVAVMHGHGEVINKLLDFGRSSLSSFTPRLHSPVFTVGPLGSIVADMTMDLSAIASRARSARASAAILGGRQSAQAGGVALGGRGGLRGSLLLIAL